MTNVKEMKEFEDQQVRDKVESRLDELAENYESWEGRTNKQLYKILADCMAVALDIRDDKIDVKRKGLDKLLKDRGIGFNNGTTFFNKVLKLVVGAERKRTSKYAMVLDKADCKKIKPDGLADWIEANSGIENIVASNKKGNKNGKAQSNKTKKTNYVEAGKKLIKKCPTIKTVGHVPELKFQNGVVVLLGKFSKKKGIELLNFQPNQGVLEHVYSSAGKKRSGNVNTTTSNQNKQKLKLINIFSKNKQRKPAKTPAGVGAS